MPAIFKCSRAWPVPTRLSSNKLQVINLLLHRHKGYFGNTGMLNDCHYLC